MKTILLKITAQSPLAIGRRKLGVVNEAEDYIPGSVIRGAIAQQILQQTGYESDDLSQNGGDFQQLFLDDSCGIFQNAYPSPNNQISSVLPATVVSSKTNPGFKPKGNGIFDTLIDRFCAEFYQHPYDPNCPKDKDGERVEPFSGFYTVENDQHQTHSVSKRLLTRTGINRRRNVVEEDILYSLEVLNESSSDRPSIYQGKIFIADDNLADTLAYYINQNSERFRFGSSRSRGLGKGIIEATVTDTVSDVSFRLQQFNQGLQTRWKKWGTLLGNTSQQLQPTYFTLNLQSETILTDQWRKTTLLTPAMLQEETGIKDDSLQLHTAYTSYDYRSGWNSAWGMMKDMELVINRGGVYLFSTTQPDSWEKELEKLKNRGIGERTCEGFGQIEICSPFHLVFREEAK